LKALQCAAGGGPEADIGGKAVAFEKGDVSGVAAIAEGGDGGDVEHVRGASSEGLHMIGGEIEDTRGLKEGGDLQGGDAVDERGFVVAGAVQGADGEDIGGWGEVGGSFFVHSLGADEGGAGEAGGCSLGESVQDGASPVPVASADAVGPQ